MDLFNFSGVEERQRVGPSPNHHGGWSSRILFGGDGVKLLVSSQMRQILPAIIRYRQ